LDGKVEEIQFEIRKTRHINEEIVKNELPKMSSTLFQIVELLAETKLMAMEEKESESAMKKYF
jgi:hypothetical protein